MRGPGSVVSIRLRHTTREIPIVKEIMLNVWEFADAPDHLRGIVPLAYTDGWLAFIHPEGGEVVARTLMDRWNSLGFSLARFQLEDGGIVLAGQHPPHSTPGLPLP